MSMLLAEPETGLCTCDLAPAVGVTEATTSFYLKDAGLCEGTRRGTNVYYRPNSDALGALVTALDPNCC